MAVSRRQFLRGDFAARGTPLRPPWALSEDAFVDRCTRCDACADACPGGIIVRGQGGFPAVDFTRGACTFCGDCAAACREGALARGGPPWTVKAAIGAGCVTLRQVVCQSCGDACEAGAIGFRPRAGAVPVPQLDPIACSGCGACQAACPVGAIAMRHTETAAVAA